MKTNSNLIKAPTVELPKGGGALKSIDEKLSVNAINGTSTFTIPIPITKFEGITPNIELTYDSGKGNGIFGLGWSLDIPSIRRKTNNELPQYRDSEESDTFLLSGFEDLVPEYKKNNDGSFVKDSLGNYTLKETESPDNIFKIRFYKPRIEGIYSRIERWTNKNTGEIKWRVLSKKNITALYGWTSQSCLVNPLDETKIYEWLPEFIFDDKGNGHYYKYKKEDKSGFDRKSAHNKNRLIGEKLSYTKLYIEKIFYGNKTPYLRFGDPFPLESDYAFQTIFDYGEYNTNSPYDKTNDWEYRKDSFSSYRSGFEIRTTRLCKRVLLYHFFNDLPGGAALVKSLNLNYDSSDEDSFTLLKSYTLCGYIKKTDGSYTQKIFPAGEFEYQKHEWNAQLQSLASEDIKNVPAGIDEQRYLFTDLYNEGLSGILTEQADGWYYKQNKGEGKFENGRLVSEKPSWRGLNHLLQLTDLEADGSKQLVNYSKEPQGYFEFNDEDNKWQSFHHFEKLPNIDFNHPNTQFIDLNGDGKADLLITEENVFTWYSSEGKKGFGDIHSISNVLDEESGPNIVFSDTEQCIFLADMSGDGLTDIVRIRNREVCYWSNMGFGHFGTKITLDNAPTFDYPDLFNPELIKLADIDGSGTTDIIYLGKNRFSCWINHCGNSMSATPFEINSFPEIHSHSNVDIIDLLGTGMSCIVWSGLLEKNANIPIKYIDLKKSKKPNIMVSFKNNLGKEIALAYKPSTKYYIEDKLSGKPWVTKLHFPVHCVSKIETRDTITGSKFISSYKYRHGYYDHAEREFRGFGMVEQTDIESFEHLTKNKSGQLEEKMITLLPKVAKTWHHTGAFISKEKILGQFANEYWHKEMEQHGYSVTNNEALLTDAEFNVSQGLDSSLLNQLKAEEWCEALRACKSFELRTETYAKDAPENVATEEQKKKELMPFNVSENNCLIELVQPKGQNKHAVFSVNERESISYTYERDSQDPRIEHKLNIQYDAFSNILESASIVYPRATQDASLPNETQKAQNKTIITYVENKYTNDINTYEEYLLPLPSESKNFELKGILSSEKYYSINNFNTILNTSSEVDYKDKDSEPTPGNTQKRLLEHLRVKYYKNDLTDALPLHQIESKGILYESYQLAFTPNLLTDIFGSKINDSLMLEGKFEHNEGDNNWWIPSGIKNFIELTETIGAAKNRFYQPISYTDPYGSKTRVKYWQGYHMLLEETEDALNNKNKVLSFNLRTLKPQQLQDQNDNITEALSDELGIVKAVASLGKGVEADNLTGHTEYRSSTEDTLIESFFTASNSDDISNHAKSLLKNATARFVYDFDIYKNSNEKSPIVVASIYREEHYSRNSNSDVQIKFEYKNGFLQEQLKKIQAEPGIANKIIINPDNSYSINSIDTRTIGSGQLRWLVDNNKIVNNNGEIIKEYEPYFSTTRNSESTKEIAVSTNTSVSYYDALNRLVKKEMPNGTFIKTAYKTWQQIDYDENDTILDSEWYDNRFNRKIDTQLSNENKNPAKEKLAAEKAAKHANTPTILHYDNLGETVLQIGHNKDAANADIFYCTSAKFDTEGNLDHIKDARNNEVMHYKYDMLGDMAYQNSVDSGKRWILNNIMDNPVRTWDERNHEIHYTYDALHRPTGKRVIGGDSTSSLNNEFEKTIYGEGQTFDKSLNLRGQPVKIYDTAGVLEIPEYDFKGKAKRTMRKLVKDYKNAVNWNTSYPDSKLEGNYTFISEFDALERIIKQITPDGSTIIPSYNKTGLFHKEVVEQNINGSIETTECIKNIEYNEKGSKEKIIYGNNISTKNYYDKENYRLIRIETKRQNNDPLQDLRYTYDPSGNINFIEDKNIPTVFFNNQKIEGTSEYTYDALYRLTESKGREHIAQTAFGNNDNWDDKPFLKQYSQGDSMAWQNYSRQYNYDKAGNILQEKHIANNNNSTRNYNYSANNNRLISTSAGSNTYNYAQHTKHGFITSLPHLQFIKWDFNDQILSLSKQHINNGTPETTYYQYDGKGERIRKITESQSSGSSPPVKKEERIYFSSYELYKKHNGNHAGLERHTLSLIDDGRRFGMIEIRNNIDDGTDKKMVRYQHDNYVNSVSIETNQLGKIINYEEYYPFGTTSYQAVNKDINAAAKRYRYTGKERDDESGLLYHGARYYVPWLARWLSPDPVGIEDGLNLFTYVGNNPIRKNDQNGLNGCDPQVACCPPTVTNVPLTSSDQDLLREETQVRQQEDLEQSVVTNYETYTETYTVDEVETFTVRETSSTQAGAFMGGTLILAGGTSQLDSPFPGPADAVAVGEIIVGGIIALGILAFASTQVTTRTRVRPRTRTRTRRRRARLVYITYTMTNPITGQVYSGRSRGYGTPQQVLAARGSSHHMTARGFGPPVLDRFVYATLPITARHLDPSYHANRGREQQLIDSHGGSLSDFGTSGNAIRGVSKINPLGRVFHLASDLLFGNIHAYTGY